MSLVSQLLAPQGVLANVRAVFFLVEVTTERLRTLAELFDRGELKARVGSEVPLADVRSAHEMLAGAPQLRGKILLSVGNAVI